MITSKHYTTILNLLEEASEVIEPYNEGKDLEVHSARIRLLKAQIFFRKLIDKTARREKKKIK